MNTRALEPYGWTDRWSALLAEHPECQPARVLRHDGSSLLLATVDGPRPTPLSRRLEPAPTVGDWIACHEQHPVAVLPRSSLLRRRAAGQDAEQALAANVDLVLLVCGLDRPVKAGRINRGATLAWDAGAVPVVVLTKAVLGSDVDGIVDDLRADCPGIDILVTSALEGEGLDALRDLAVGRTVTMLGESGAGKSSLVNALLGEGVTATGDVRGDGKGRHTTTSRELHVLPAGGVLIDTPGTREVGLWVDPGAVDATFADVDWLASGCRFGDCRHDREPGCAVVEAVAAGGLAADRLDAWRALRREAESAELRANPHELRKRNKQFGRLVKEANKHKIR